MARSKTVHPPHVIKKVLAMRREGYTKAHIRDAVDLSEDAVAAILSKHKNTLPIIKTGNRHPAPPAAL